MNVGQLIAELLKLDPTKTVVAQVVAEDGSAWNCWYSFNDIPNTSLVQLALSHSDLKTLPGKLVTIEFEGAIVKDGVSKEMDVIIDALKNDPEYYISWQANIAMAFKDECVRMGLTNNSTGKIHPVYHDVANNAAASFLKLLMDAR